MLSECRDMSLNVLQGAAMHFLAQPTEIPPGPTGYLTFASNELMLTEKVCGFKSILKTELMIERSSTHSTLHSAFRSELQNYPCCFSTVAFSGAKYLMLPRSP